VTVVPCALRGRGVEVSDRFKIEQALETHVGSEKAGAAVAAPVFCWW
jgi:hypothetical protein